MRTIALLALLTSSPALAYADSDGYYCHGPGYLAWETRRGTVAGEHVLHVVRFAHAGGVAPTQNVVMPEFQVHGMVCGPQAIEVAGWTTSYRVDLTDQHRPMVTSEPAVFDANRTPQQNLGFAARAPVSRN